MSELSLASLDDKDNEELEAVLLDRPIACLRDLQYVYGALYTLANAGSGPYAKVLTPWEAADLVGEPESVIGIRIDVSGDQPSYEGLIPPMTYEPSMATALAHSFYDGRGSGIDHSLTHRSGMNKSPEKLGKYAYERLTRWPTEDAVQAVADSHPDGHLIHALAALGENDDVCDAIQSEVEAALEEKRTSLITVQLRTTADGEWQWPGSFDVFNEAAKRQLLHKLSTKSMESESSGRGVCQITGEEADLVGSMMDPNTRYLTKHKERFENFDDAHAWANHPISEDAALIIRNAQPLIDGCERYIYGYRVYLLPYYTGMLTAERARNLYRVLRFLRHKDRDQSPLYHVYLDTDHADADDLRFYISAEINQQANRSDVIGEATSSRILPLVDLAEAHQTLVDGPWFSEDIGFPTRTYPKRLSLIDPSVTSIKLFEAITDGTYFRHMFPYVEDTTATDARVIATFAVFEGRPLTLDFLLDKYTARSTANQSEDEKNRVPIFLIAEQHAQLRSLYANGLVSDAALDRALSDRRTTLHMDSQPTDTDPESEPLTPAQAAASDRAERVAAYIAEDPFLSAHEARKTAFLVGALVGYLSKYQYSVRKMNRTLREQYPPSRVNKEQMMATVSDVIDHTIKYSSIEGRLLKNGRLVDLLRESLHTVPVDDWDISRTEVQYAYGLGLTYAATDSSPETEATEADDTEAALVD